MNKKDRGLISYVSIYFLSTLSGLNSILYRRKSDNLISAFIFIALLFLVTFRGGGFGLGDYDNYRRFYNLVLTWSDVINISVPAEIGFRFFLYWKYTRI